MTPATPRAATAYRGAASPIATIAAAIDPSATAVSDRQADERDEVGGARQHLRRGGGVGVPERERQMYPDAGEQDALVEARPGAARERREQQAGGRPAHDQWEAVEHPRRRHVGEHDAECERDQPELGETRRAARPAARCAAASVTSQAGSRTYAPTAASTNALTASSRIEPTRSAADGVRSSKPTAAAAVRAPSHAGAGGERADERGGEQRAEDAERGDAA
jgi:hypothetical protein